MQQSVVNIEFSAVPANELNSAIPHQRVALSNLTEPEKLLAHGFQRRDCRSRKVTAIIYNLYEPVLFINNIPFIHRQ